RRVGAAGRHGSTSAMPNRSPRLFTHSVGGGGDVTHSTSVANVALSWPMTPAMTNAHVLRRPCFARTPLTSRVPRIRRDSSRVEKSGAAFACGPRHALSTSHSARVGSLDSLHQRRLRGRRNL